MWNDNEDGLALGANHLMGYKLNVNKTVFFFFFFLKEKTNLVQHLLALGPWAGFFIALCLVFHIC